MHDLVETADSKFQASYFSSVSSKAGTAHTRGVPHTLQQWVFVPRLRDTRDGKEFHGTPDNVKRFPQHEAVLCVFDDERDIITENFSLSADGCIPEAVIVTLKAKLRQKTKKKTR